VKRVRNRSARFRCVFGCSLLWILKELGEFKLGYVVSTVGMISFVLDFILHTAYAVFTCALTSILPSLYLIDTIYCSADTKATPASFQGVGLNF
jgi:hypothetical protein